ncbi:MAG TPA: carbohydrate porin, partial [Candidatus Kapabacteria bacterium]|nr:carbohydrate porin [Candidatus Kapabacteria bacterium]
MISSVRIVNFSILIVMCVFGRAFAQETTHSDSWNLHFQQTVVGQYHFDFHSPYSGINSLQAHEGDAYSVTSTLFLGAKLWQGGEIYFDPELAGGSGLSGAVGVAGALNGETYRIGTPAPSLAIARLYLQENIALSDSLVQMQDVQNQIGEFQPARRITITAGKYAVSDQFDANSFSHDPRSQFLNWSLMSAGAWDYPADTKGYTIGITVEYITPEYSLRAASDAVVTEANLMEFDTHLSGAHSETVEFELPHHMIGESGILRLLAFHTMAHMGNYLQAINKAYSSNTIPDITTTRAYGRSKYGFELNLEEQLSNRLGTFARASWNDGKNETWMFTEIDHSVCAG